MSKGLEALERLGAEKLARGELIRNDDKVENYIQSIKQDLEMLEIIKANFGVRLYDLVIRDLSIMPDNKDLIKLKDLLEGKFLNQAKEYYAKKVMDYASIILKKPTKDESRKRLQTNLEKMIQADATGKDDEWASAVHDLFKMIDDIYDEKSL